MGVGQVGAVASSGVGQVRAVASVGAGRVRAVASVGVGQVRAVASSGAGPGSGPVSVPTPRYEDLIGLWQDGQRRLRELDPGPRIVAERVIDALVDDLRRRLGGPFLVQELANLATVEGTDWCFDLAVRAAPTTPEAWDLTTVANAAFARYAREASDYSTGRRISDAGG